MPNRGGAQSRGDVLVSQLADGTPLEDIWNELTDDLDVYNEHRSAIASLLSYSTTNVTDAVPQNVNAEPFEKPRNGVYPLVFRPQLPEVGIQLQGLRSWHSC